VFVIITKTISGQDAHFTDQLTQEQQAGAVAGFQQAVAEAAAGAGDGSGGCCTPPPNVRIERLGSSLGDTALDRWQAPSEPLTYPTTTPGQQCSQEGRLGDHWRRAQRSATICSYVYWELVYCCINTHKLLLLFPYSYVLSVIHIRILYYSYSYYLQKKFRPPF
jgi:hypothetical protein